MFTYQVASASSFLSRTHGPEKLLQSENVASAGRAFQSLMVQCIYNSYHEDSCYFRLLVIRTDASGFLPTHCINIIHKAKLLSDISGTVAKGK